MSAPVLQVWALEGIGEVAEGHDLVDLIVGAAGGTLRTGDILVVTSKVVSKAEGRSVSAENREQAITDETIRVVATKVHPGGATRIVENRLGIVAAAAGVDSSNAPPGTVLLLPEDPDASARRLVAGLRRRLGVAVGVVVTDTLGRAWRIGQTDAAIGAASVRVVEDLRGSTDDHGLVLSATVTAVADEIAAAADLVKGKTRRCPVAVVRGLAELVVDAEHPAAREGASVLVRPAEDDMFRRGSKEAWEEGYATALAEPAAGGTESDPVEGKDSAITGRPVTGCSRTCASTP